LISNQAFTRLPSTMATNASSFASNMQMPSLDVSNFLSIGDLLGGKKIDNTIENARYAGIPQQGSQTGGYSPSYAHLSHIPLFPLYCDAQLEVLAKCQQRKEHTLSHVPPPQQVSTKDKLLMSAMTHLSGGVNPLSMKKWERRFQGASAITG
jgi:hypothetical protein